jgi:hypothetical protein
MEGVAHQGLEQVEIVVTTEAEMPAGSASVSVSMLLDLYEL